jgi:SNF2 family DNA or RNA helicase
VANVAKDLPERIVIEEALAGTDQFNSIYEEVRKEAIADASNVLATITKLTQLCCYPRLIDKTYSDPHDAKLVRLLEILRSVQERGDQKAIIFSTYTESLDLIKAVVSRQLEPNFISTIDGRVSAQNRIAIIDSFEAIKGFAVLCIQPKAGGIGLNITAANHVIHFNRQWNPALESQATARAHRRGQLKTVFEYLMFYVGTIEEYISQTLSRKVELASEGTSQSVLEGSAKDINAALSLSPISTFSTLERFR